MRKRVDWLNGRGGFDNRLDSSKVAEAAGGIDLTQAMKILKDLEEKKDEVRDPTAFVTAAFRKMGGGSRGSGGGRNEFAAPPANWGPPPAQSGGAWGQASEVETEDKKLRKRIGWLNSQGGFGGAIIYDKIMEAAGGLEFSEVFRGLSQLEEKGDSVKDPTAWVCAALRRSASKGGMHAPQMAWSGGGGWGGPEEQWGGGSAPMELDADATSRLHKRVKWLNDPDRFDNALQFDKVKEAAVGLDSRAQMEVLKDLEENQDTVKDPLAYVTSKMRKAGGGGGGGQRSFGVKRTIGKVRR